MADLFRFSGEQRLLVLAPHPDDEVLACGGLLQRASQNAAAVRVVFATNGENNPWPQRLIERRWRLGAEERARWGHIRRREALAALATLGLCEGVAWFLGFPDQGLTDALMTCAEPVISSLQQLLHTWAPTLVVAPSLQDLHPDHSALMVMLMIALQRLSDAQGSRPSLISYVVHGTPRHDDRDVSLSLSEAEVETKRRALLCHQSQLALSRSRLMAHATPVEAFREEGDGRPARVRQRRCRDTTLSLGPWTWKDWIKPPLVRVVADDAKCRTWTQRPSLANRVAPALPEGSWPTHTVLFVKRERRWVFFDERGWEVSVPALPRRHEAPRSRARVVCVVPCYDVAPYCAAVLRDAIAAADCVIAVDDGSRDRTPRILTHLAQTSGGKLRVMTLTENRGKGVALVNGLRFAVEHFDFDALVTLDSDGQHQPRDVPRLVDQVTAGADLVLGARALDEMPLRSRIGNSLSATVLRALFANAPRDTQCGMRAFSPSFVREVVALVPGGRYETEAWVLLLALERGVRVRTVPIPTLYEPRNASSHYRPLRDSARIMGALVRWRLERPGWQSTDS